MTDKEKIDAIRKEVERLKEENHGSPISLCDDLLSFIDSMQETEFKETEVLKRKLSNIAKAIYEHKGPENPTIEHIREIVQDCCFELMDLEKEHVDYDKLDTMLDDALSKETKESWNKRLGEEPVSEEWIEELRTKLDSMSKEDFKKVFDKYAIDFKEEPVSEDLEDACEQLAENARKHKAETSSPFFSQTDYRQGVMDGAKWQKAHLLKPADGDDLKDETNDM